MNAVGEPDTPGLMGGVSRHPEKVKVVGRLAKTTLSPIRGEASGASR